MAIQSSELKYYQPTTINDTTSNGGRMTITEIADGVKNNIWPDVPQGERVNGSTKYRKAFIKVANDDDIILIDPRIFVETHTPGDDRVLIFPGSQTDVQGDITGSERLYGSGSLDVDVLAGDTTIDVNTESQADGIFQNGDLVRISDKDSVNDANGSVELLLLDPSTGVTWSGDKATLTFASGVTLANGFSAANTKISSVIEPANIEGSWDSWSGSTAAGTYDGSSPATPPTTNIPVLDSIGSVEQTWTITFSDAVNFSCVGDTLGTVGSGSIGGGDFTPNNADYSKPYFTLPDTGWGGTWANGETITFRTHPAAVAIWEKRVVPPGANSLSANKVIIAITGESA
jgi:hypothetical protein